MQFSKKEVHYKFENSKYKGGLSLKDRLAKLDNLGKLAELA